jgi:serine/threonine protein kinase
MAPEILSRSPYDIKADVWAIGVLLFIMLYGETPFSSL